MGTFLRNLRRSASSEELAELQRLASRLEAQHSSLEQLVQHADRSIGQLQRLGTLGERVSTLERQLAAVEQLAARLGAAESQLAGLSGSHQRLDNDLAETAAKIERAKAEASAVSESVAAAQRLKEDLTGFLALEGPFRQLRGDIESAQAQGEAFRSELSRLREQHEKTQGNYKAAANRIEAFDADWQRITRTLTETEHRIAGLEQLLGDMAPIAESVAQTRRQLATAKATADQLGQKMALLDQQRDVVDRATGKLEHLTALMQRADAGLDRQAEMVRMLAELRTQVDTLHDGHLGLQERTRAAQDRLERIEVGQASAERAITGLREGLEQNAERLSLETRSVEALGQRLADLRRGLAEWEDRFQTLASTGEAIGASAARADTLSLQVGELAARLSEMSELTHRARAGLSDLERLEESIAGLTERTCRVEESRPALERTVRDLQSLTATGEAIRDALEQLRNARQELMDTRMTVDGTRRWLGDAERQMASLQGDVAGLDRMRATLDALRQEVDQLAAQISLVEARKELVVDVHRRLSDAAQLGATIEERARGLAERIGTAEDRLESMEPRLDEVGRAGNQLLSLGADLREMEQRVRSVQGSVGGVEERARSLEAVAERMHDLAREVDQRQHAIARAAEHLDRAATLRQEAAEAAELLAERARTLDGALETAGGRLTECETLSRELDARIGSLLAIQERITMFEAKLAEWRTAEQQLTQALDLASTRQATISSLQSEIRGLYEIAERTQADARSVAEAHPQIARTRAELEALLGRLGDADGVMRTLEDRRRQLDRTEERLAHADTLMTDVRVALETLLAQKAQVDHFLEKATSLSLEARRVEGLIDTLREERRITDRIQAALSDLRRQEEVSLRVDAAATA
jgi:chromosome segregation ATPase